MEDSVWIFLKPRSRSAYEPAIRPLGIYPKDKRAPPKRHMLHHVNAELVTVVRHQMAG